MIVTFLVFKIFSAFTDNMLKVLAIHVFKQIPLTSSQFNSFKTKYIKTYFSKLTPSHKLTFSVGGILALA